MHNDEITVRFVQNIDRKRTEVLVNSASTIRYLCEELGIPCKVSRENIMYLNGILINKEDIDKPLAKFDVGKQCCLARTVINEIA